MRQILSVTILAGLLAWACNGKKVDRQDYSQCRFSYNPADTKLQWTAYKFTEKLGVTGSLHTFSATGTRESQDPMMVFQGASFSVDGQSVDSANPERDKKITSAFFSALKDKGRITGKVEKINGAEADLTLTMNGVQKALKATIVAKSKTELEIKLPLNVHDFKADQALKGLNKVCSELHKGKDMKSVLWPDVDVRISVKLSPICPS